MSAPDETRLRLGPALQYGLFALPLAAAGLPIYLTIPDYYARHTPLSVGEVGVLLLATRLAAALADPMLGAWAASLARASRAWIALACLLLIGGMLALFHPPAQQFAAQPLAAQALPAGGAASLWLTAALLATYIGYGMATIVHQSIGAALWPGQDERLTATAAREACALGGVLLAAPLAQGPGLPWLLAVFVLGLPLSGLLLARTATALPHAAAASLQLPASSVGGGPLARCRAAWRNREFRRLFAVLLANGLASAIPATLFLFFVDELLGARTWSGALLLLYLCAGAAAIPLWARLARRLGEVRAWRCGMLLSVACFSWTLALEAGSAHVLPAFAMICLGSGIALGADLALPGALLTGVIARAEGQPGQKEGAYFGIWNAGVQLTLAVAAGSVLPALEWSGFEPGQGQSGNGALLLAYAALPCLLKLCALAMLWRSDLPREPIRRPV